jgi:protoporphyrin/coproporphyrin ferrochelatase
MSSTSRMVILANIGSPEHPTAKSVAPYLRRFLGDARVIDIPAPIRSVLVNGIIVPFRAKKSAAKYASVWMEEGAPLMVLSERLRKHVQAQLPNDTVVLGMRYSEPFLHAQLDKAAQQKQEVVVVPLYPQYALASTESTLDAVVDIRKKHPSAAVKATSTFYNDDGFLDAQAALIARHLPSSFDALLLTYHSIPLKQAQKTVTGGHICAGVVDDASCCAVLTEKNALCYRAQCVATSKALQQRLSSRLGGARVFTSYQSRLAGQQWLAPSTDDTLKRLPALGIKKLAVASPSFATDCLETVQELGLEGREDFMHAGGTGYTLIPCLNDDVDFAACIARWVNAA